MKKIILGVLLIMGIIVFIPGYGYSGWRIETVDSNNAGVYSSLKLDKNGNSHISYAGNNVLKYASWNGSTWITQTIDTSGVPISTSIDLNTQDKPSIAYIISNALKYCSYENGTWSIQYIDSGSYLRPASLDIDSQSLPHISYGKGDPYPYLQYAHYNGFSWNTQGVADGNRRDLFSSIAIDTNGYPHITFYQDWDGEGYCREALKYVYWTGSDWNISFISSGNRCTGEWSSIKIDSTGYPHISCLNINDNDLIYIYKTGSNWYVQTVDSGGNVGEFTSLALDSNNRPHISYYDRTNGNLKYAYWNGTSWQVQVVDNSEGDVGQWSSVSLDANNNPHISYYDVTNNALKYASFHHSISITPTSGTVGTIVTVAGEGFGTTELIRIDFGNKITITTTTSSSGGTFMAIFTVDTQPYGSTTVRARGVISWKTVEAVFRILPKIAYVNPTMGTVGSMVTVAGNGYRKNELVAIAFGMIRTIQITYANDTGSFVTTFTADTQPYGTTTISVFGLTSGVWACNTFFIHANIILLTPTYGTAGSIVTIRGNGYGANEQVRITFGTTRTIQLTSTNVYGSFTTAFTINTQPYGTTTIMAAGLRTNARADATFNIRGTILVISPWQGTVGTPVRIIGNGFGASEGIHILFGTTGTIGTTVTNTFGRFDTTFTVDTQPYGTTTIRVVGLSTQQQAMMMMFFIVPNIILVTPTMGTVGTFVTIAGNGFGQMEGVRIDFGTTMSICNITSNASGTFSALFTINIQPDGLTTIAVSGLVSGSPVLATFTIVPKITQVLPSSGTVGSFVTVRGNGFGATESIKIKFGTTRTIAFAATTARGEFEVIFTVNTQPIGTTTIAAYGMMTGSCVRAYFVILPSTILKVTPSLQNIAVNSTFTAQVEIGNVEQFTGADIYLRFNPNILEVEGIGTGTFPPTNGSEIFVVQHYDNNSGGIHYGVGLGTGGSATGSGILCSLRFRAKSSGTSSVVFEFDGPPNNHLTRLRMVGREDISFTKEEALYRIINGISISPKDRQIRADEKIDYTCRAICNGLELDVTGSTTFSSNGGGSFTLNSFLAKYMGTYTIQGTYLGFIGTTSIIIIPGTPTTLLYVSGNNQVSTCTDTLKEPFIVKVVDKYNNPCNGVEVNWQIIDTPSTNTTGHSISPSNTTTNIQGTASTLLTLGTEPPGTYTIHAISLSLTGSPYVFTANSLRRWGTIAGFCMLNLGTNTLGTSSDIQVRIEELGTTTTTNNNSYFIFQMIPVGTYILTFDTWGASPASKTNVCISPTQFEDTTNIGTMTLLAGDVNNDGQVNTQDWSVLAAGWKFAATSTMSNWENYYKEGDFDHTKQVNILDFEIFRDNYNKQQEKGRAKKLAAMPAKAKKTTNESSIKLSFDLETLEGVDKENLRIGNIIWLKINIADARNTLCGEVHLSFNPDVLEVVNVPVPSTVMPAYKGRTYRLPADGEVKIQQGNYLSPAEPDTYVLLNKVDNTAGKIDYAVVSLNPETKDSGVFAIVPFRIKSCGAQSNVSFDVAPEENRETVFTERVKEPTPEEIPIDVPYDVSRDEVIIKVPQVFNNLDSAYAYPNPAYKDKGHNEIIFEKLTTDKQVTLKIYTLAGELVIEKEKEKVTNNYIKWNLKNKDNEQVASGIYIYFLRDPSGSTKRGKVGVIK